MNQNRQAIQQRIEDNLKGLVQPAQLADEILESLKAQNLGRFDAIFPKHSAFTCRATRFLPYLEEVSADTNELSKLPDSAFELGVQNLLTKIGMLHQILATFHEIRDDSDEE